MDIVELIITEEQKQNFCKEIGVPWLRDFLAGNYSDKEPLREVLGCIKVKNIDNIYIIHTEDTQYRIYFKSEEHKTKFVLKYC